MKPHHLSGVFLLVAIFILICGCMEPPIKEPSVLVTDIAVSDVSLQTMTVNTTVIINNPNPIGAKLNKVAFDVYYLDEGENYLGHGERSGIDVKENGNTTVTIPVTIGNIPALKAVGSLVQKGSITLNVNGSAFIDVRVTSFEKRFEQSRQFQLSDFEGLLPVTSIPGTSINVTDKLQQLGGLLGAVSG
jgi:LEA14-like dessication related protein